MGRVCDVLDSPREWLQLHTGLDGFFPVRMASSPHSSEIQPRAAVLHLLLPYEYYFRAAQFYGASRFRYTTIIFGVISDRNNIQQYKILSRIID
jgi:hypothetical protein